jgi:hypothetical protein
MSSDRSTTRLEALLRDVRAVRKRHRSTRIVAKNCRIPFRIFGNILQNKGKGGWRKNQLTNTVIEHRIHSTHLTHSSSIWMWAGRAQSVEWPATAWTVRGSSPGGGEIFRTRPDRPWGPPSPLYNGSRVFPGGKVAGAWGWPPTPSSSEVKERIEPYIDCPSGPSWSVWSELIHLDRWRRIIS